MNVPGSIVPMKGDQVKLNAAGRRLHLDCREWRGTVLGNIAQWRGLIRVRWSHQRTPHTYTLLFIEAA